MSASARSVVGPGGRAPAGDRALDRLGAMLAGEVVTGPAVLEGDDRRAEATEIVTDLMAPFMAQGMTRVQALAAVMDARASRTPAP